MHYYRNCFRALKRLFITPQLYNGAVWWRFLSNPNVMFVGKFLSVHLPGFSINNETFTIRPRVRYDKLIIMSVVPSTLKYVIYKIQNKCLKIPRLKSARAKHHFLPGIEDLGKLFYTSCFSFEFQESFVNLSSTFDPYLYLCID